MPSRSEALTALYAAQNKPVTKIEATGDSDRNRAGMTYTPAYTGRVRDRQTVETATVALPKTERDFDAEAAAHRANLQRQGAEARARRERQEQERARVAEAHRLEDQRRKEMLERNQEIVLGNLAKAEIRQALQDATADEVEAVLTLVREWKMEKQPFAYDIALTEVRSKK